MTKEPIPQTIGKRPKIVTRFCLTTKIPNFSAMRISKVNIPMAQKQAKSSIRTTTPSFKMNLEKTSLMETFKA